MLLYLLYSGFQLFGVIRRLRLQRLSISKLLRICTEGSILIVSLPLGSFFYLYLLTIEFVPSAVLCFLPVFQVVASVLSAVATFFSYNFFDFQFMITSSMQMVRPLAHRAAYSE